MVRLLSILTLACLIGTTVGCGARVEVAKKNVMNQIDKMLGELDVKLESINQNITKLENARDKIQSEKNRMNAELGVTEQELTPMKKDLERIKAAAKKIQPYLVSEEAEIDIDGKKYSKEDLTAKVKKLIAAGNSKTKTIEALEKNMKLIEKSRDMLKDQQGAAEKRLTKLTSSIEEIKLKKKSLDALKVASSSATENITDTFDDTEKEIRDLMVAVDGQLADIVEDTDRAATTTTSTEDILKDFETSDDVSSELSEFLKDE